MEDENEKTMNTQKPTDPTREDVYMRISVPDVVLQSNVWAGEVVRKWINRGKVPDEQVTPNGVDLTVNRIFKQRGNVILARKKEDSSKGALWEIPTLHNIAGLSNKEGWILDPGFYTVQWAEHICIPSNAIGLLLPRSTLVRTCATIYGAVWDRGYHGVGQSGLHLFDYMILERGTALAQMFFIEASVGDKLYDGQYQNEGEIVDASKEKKD